MGTTPLKTLEKRAISQKIYVCKSDLLGIKQQITKNPYILEMIKLLGLTLLPIPPITITL